MNVGSSPPERAVSHQWLLNAAARLYAWFQRLLPVAWRKRFGADASDLFRDLTADAYRRGGVGRLLRISIRIYLRTVAAAIGEHVHRGNRLGNPRHPARSFRGGYVLHLRQDIGFALREFRKRPAFSLTAIFTIALGIAAVTTIFSVVDTVVLRRLPYPHENRLVYFDEGSHTGPDYREWQERFQTFDQIAAVWTETANLTNEGYPAQVVAARSTANLFPLLGARPHIGRLLVPADEQADQRVAVLSHRLWTSRWGQDSSMIGRQILLDGESYEIVGVASADLLPPPRVVRSDPDIWLALDATRDELQQRTFYVLGVVGLLAPTATIEMATAEMDAWETWAAEHFPDQYVSGAGRHRDIPLRYLHDATVEQARPTLLMLLGAVALMLLIACANVANLSLARGTDRAREVAVRSALGASRFRIITQSLTESILLSTFGGMIGVAASLLTIRAVTALARADIPRLASTTIDLRILSFATVVSVATGILFGMAPAFYAARTDIGDVLKDASHRASAGRSRLRLKSGLVVLEMALAIILLVGAGLLFNSFLSLQRVDPGFSPEKLLVVPLQLGPAYDEPEGRRIEFAHDIVDRLVGLPGVASAAVGVTAPFSMSGRCCYMTTARANREDTADSVRIVLHPVSPTYFATLGAALQGAALPWNSDSEGESVAVMSSRMKARFFPDRNPIGQTVSVGRSRSAYRIVGVVDDIRHWSLSRDDDIDLYVPYDDLGASVPFLSIIVRTELDPSTAGPMVRKEIWAQEWELPVPEITSMETRLQQSFTDTRFLSMLLTTFSGVAMLLAATGVYATMLFSVMQRRHEFGVRIALGADAQRLTRHVMGRGAFLTILGLTLGFVGALASTRVLTNMVFGVTTTDASTFAAAALLLGLVAIVACYLPARRITRVDPMVTLRTD